MRGLATAQEGLSAQWDTSQQEYQAPERWSAPQVSVSEMSPPQMCAVPAVTADLAAMRALTLFFTHPRGLRMRLPMQRIDRLSTGEVNAVRRNRSSAVAEMFLRPVYKGARTA